MIERYYYTLNLAAEKFGYTEDDLLHLGSTGRLPIYIYRPYCAHRKDSSPNITWRINVPILVDDPDCLSDLALGVDSMMRFSGQYPDSWLVDLSAIESEEVIDNSQPEVYESNCKELSSRQKDKLIVDGRLSVFVEEFSNSDSLDGIPITRGMVVIMTADLKLLPESSTAQESEFKDESENVADDEGLRKQNKVQKQRRTQINLFLTELCQKQNIDNLSGESLVRAIKPLVNTHNCPVAKYHGFYVDVCVEWKPGTGSPKGTWGKKSFQNFVTDFKARNTL